MLRGFSGTNEQKCYAIFSRYFATDSGIETTYCDSGNRDTFQVYPDSVFFFNNLKITA